MSNVSVSRMNKYTYEVMFKKNKGTVLNMGVFGRSETTLFNYYPVPVGLAIELLIDVARELDKVNKQLVAEIKESEKKNELPRV